MSVGELIAEIEAGGGRLLLGGGQLKYRGPESLLTPALRDALAQSRDQIAAKLTARSAPVTACDGPVERLRLSEFAASGGVVRVRSDVLGADVYFAANNADISGVPAEAVIFWPDELAHVTEAGPETLRLLWETKATLIRTGVPRPKTHQRQANPVRSKIRVSASRRGTPCPQCRRMA